MMDGTKRAMNGLELILFIPILLFVCLGGGLGMFFAPMIFGFRCGKKAMDKIWEFE